jgi:hypothetical protein
VILWGRDLARSDPENGSARNPGQDGAGQDANLHLILRNWIVASMPAPFPEGSHTFRGADARSL